jgi:HAD superfamily hydrolase (TIGR01450 family)
VAWVLDLDGVVWLGDEPIAGAADAVARLRAAGETVLFATNNSSVVIAEQEAKLARFGIPAEGGVITSAMAGAALVSPGQRVLVCGGPGVVEALERRGAVPVRDETDVDALMVGFHRDFDYERLRLAAEAVRRGARFIATNDDATYPTPEGPIPGGGAIAAAIAYAVGRPPEVAGKPHRPMADLARALAGEGARDGIMVGDRPDTDGAFAVTLGYRFGLVLTGVTAPDDLPVEPTPDVVAPDLAALVTEVLGG